MDAIAKPQGCTNFKLRRLSRQMSRLYDAEVAQSGLKTSQYSLLSNVMHLGPLRPSDLAAAMDVDASTLTRNLKPLVAAGWLTVGEGADARSRLVAITDAGRKKRAEAQRHWRHAQEKLNALLGLDRVKALHALIDESSDLLQAMGLPAQGETDEQ
ncbi:Transcriptional regulator, MarR family [Burkholderiales bacterium 8X]|nr:Transcriptional regulator, MarR family [Burkholderiales bacterium 8X]